MNTDFAFISSPAKCRLLLSLRQYGTMRMDFPKEISEIAKQDILPEIFKDIEKQQTYQFLADIGNRAAIVKHAQDRSIEDIQIGFMLQAARYLGHTDIVLFSKDKEKCRALMRNIGIVVPLLDPIQFFLNDNFDEEMIKYENHLAIFDMHDNMLDPSSFLKPIFYHFKKIWAFVEWYGETKLGILKTHLSNNSKDAYDTIRNPTIYNGMLELGCSICYYPKLKFRD